MSVVYAALVIFLLVQFTGLQIEWRGGYAPAFTYHKTGPDYAALDRHRAARTRTFERANIPAGEACWPGFRGKNGEGHYDGRFLTNWPATGLRALWRQPIGGGYSSFAIAGGLAFTTEQRRDNEVAVAYVVSDGREVWTNSWAGKFQDYFAEIGPRATPAYSEGKVYFLGAEGELRCLEAANGRQIWGDNLLAHFSAKKPTYGVAASPFVSGNRLIVLADGRRNNSVVCYDKENGAVLWAALSDQIGYSTPVLATFGGERQIIVCAQNRTVCLRLADGALLWEYPWKVQHDNLPIAQPVLLTSNRFLLSAGYFTGCAAVEVSSTGNKFSASTVWQNKNLKNKFTSSVVYQDYIYGLDEDMLTCISASTGKRLWKEGRYGYGQVLLAGDYLIVLGGEGELALVALSPEKFREIGRFQAIQGKTWNHPAVCEGKLLVRNSAEMACYQLSSEE